MKMLRIIASGIFPNPPHDRAAKMRHKTEKNSQPINIITQLNQCPLNLGGTRAAQPHYGSGCKVDRKWPGWATYRGASGLKARYRAADETAILRSCPMCSINTG